MLGTLALCGLGLLLCGKQVAEATASALELCLFVLLPSLFPFFVLSSLLISSGVVQRLAPLLERPMQAVFGLSGSCAAPVLLGALGGYPIGARSTADLYLSGQCSLCEAMHLLRFCNNAGPAFLIGVVGGGLLQDPRTGVLLWLIHLFSAFTLSLSSFNRKDSVKAKSITANTNNSASLLSTFLQSVADAFSSFLNICAFVILFAILTRLLTTTPLFIRICSLLPGPFSFWNGLSTGILELTAGSAVLASARLPRRLLLPTLSFLCGWGGISVQCQSISLLRKAGLPCRGYLLAKLLQGLLAAILTLVFCL